MESGQYKNGHSVTPEAGFRHSMPYLLLKELRIHQWAKNVLVFLPFILAHEWTNTEKWMSAVLAFFSFSLVASSVYVLNDIWDREADRQHPRKKHRPIASGRLSLFAAWVTVPLVLFAGLGMGWRLVSLNYTGVLALYWVITCSYTFYLKRKVLLDVLILAGLYTIRLYGGAVATEVIISEWLMGFSLFFFLSLALIKRYTELDGKREEGLLSPGGRGYTTGDLTLLMAIGIASGLISVLIFALYINSENVTRLYDNHRLLWFAAPVLLYWIMRMWKIAQRGRMHDDPVVFAVKDRVSLGAGALIIGLILLSTYV